MRSHAGIRFFPASLLNSGKFVSVTEGLLLERPKDCQVRPVLPNFFYSINLIAKEGPFGVKEGV